MKVQDETQQVFYVIFFPNLLYNSIEYYINNDITKKVVKSQEFLEFISSITDQYGVIECKQVLSTMCWWAFDVSKGSIRTLHSTEVEPMITKMSLMNETYEEINNPKKPQAQDMDQIARDLELLANLKFDVNTPIPGSISTEKTEYEKAGLKSKKIQISTQKW